MNWVIAASVMTALLSLLLARRYFRRVMVLGRMLDESEDARREISGFLTRFSRSISGEDGVDGAIKAAVRYICEQTDAESAAVYDVVNGYLVGAGVSGNYPLIRGEAGSVASDPASLLQRMQSDPIPVGEGFLGGMALSREAEFIPDASLDPRFSMPSIGSIFTVMAAPLVRDGMTIGVVCIVNNRLQRGKSFSAEQVGRLRQILPQLLMVKNLVSIYGEISRRDRIDQELAFARNLQMSLMPGSFPQWGTFSAHAASRSAKEMNGDFYDYIQIDDDRLLVVLGDACGKGIPACMLTFMTRSFARSLADNFTSLDAFLRDLNDKLQRDTEADRFITLGCCLINRRESLLEFGRAGHTGLIECIHHHLRILSPDGTALGILPSEFASFDTICVSMEPGTTVMMFSDGLPEATDKDQQEFGIERLSDAFFRACETGGNTPQDILDSVMGEVIAFEHEQADDQTIVLIRQNAPETAEPEKNES